MPVHKENNAERQNEVELVAEKQLAFPLDEQTYYLSISIYQFEENGKEYLHFENTRKSLYDIVIFDIENKQIAKRIPLHKTGPNGLPAVYGSRPSPDSKYILIAQNDISRLSSINDKGEVIRNYDFQTPEGKFAPLHFGSYYNTPAFVKDSCLFVEMSAHKPNMKKKTGPRHICSPRRICEQEKLNGFLFSIHPSLKRNMTISQEDTVLVMITTTKKAVWSADFSDMTA